MTTSPRKAGGLPTPVTTHSRLRLRLRQNTVSTDGFSDTGINVGSGGGDSSATGYRPIEEGSRRVGDLISSPMGSENTVNTNGFTATGTNIGSRGGDSSAPDYHTNTDEGSQPVGGPILLPSGSEINVHPAQPARQQRQTVIPDQNARQSHAVRQCLPTVVSNQDARQSHAVRQCLPTSANVSNGDVPRTQPIHNEQSAASTSGDTSESYPQTPDEGPLHPATRSELFAPQLTQDFDRDLQLLREIEDLLNEFEVDPEDLLEPPRTQRENPPHQTATIDQPTKPKKNTKAWVKIGALNIRGLGSTNFNDPHNKWWHVN
ncbi:hypothetical protein E1B28_005042 [Marasmius oreades]|uniref:Uncharacterized protein n=1 Tax=Marasmius oreades TaxID=181124 RepID=A0A9P7UZS6_9AGAR|nr:uncharacterized protein E1B28_005042 [Marasmius oreades]KAG7097719.1 hypothetical protein E1B28_005042 [Marasmius oreades]